MPKTKRIINYFKIFPTSGDTPTETTEFIKIFNNLVLSSQARDASRFIPVNRKLLYVSEVRFDAVEKRIFGKLLDIRMTFPEIMNTSDDTIRSIEAADTEGIIETTHFILSYKNSLLLALEYNHYGPRILDFVNYISSQGKKMDILNTLTFLPVTKDDLESYRRRINRCSFIIAEIRKDNIHRLEEYDNDLFSAAETISHLDNPEYISIRLKYDYKKRTGTSTINEKIDNIISKLSSRRNTDFDVFDKLKVKAEDRDFNNRLKEFDLLNIWTKSQVNVDLKSRSKSIQSNDLYELMQIEIQKEFGL